MLEESTTIGLALVVLYILVKDVIKPLVDRKNGNGLHLYGQKLEDLHSWHAPDGDGEQSWKGKQIERLLIQMNKLIAEQTRESKRGNEALEKLLDEQRRSR